MFVRTEFDEGRVDEDSKAILIASLLIYLGNQLNHIIWRSHPTDTFKLLILLSTSLP